jgi:hypothetical protein
MSNQITTAFVEQYRDNVTLLTQQRMSKLRNYVRNENVNGKSAFYEQIGPTTAQKRTSRHADTPLMDTPHERRRVTLDDWWHNDIVDNEDQIRMLINPTSMYAQNSAAAMGRAMDEVLLEAAVGTAYTGVDGSTSTAFDTSMVVDVITRWPGVGSADYGLNVAKILEAAKLLGANDVDPDDEKYMVINSRQLNGSLLKDTKISSHDFNAIKPLVDGVVSRFGGFTMIPCERLTTDANGDDRIVFWAKGGLCLGIGQEMKVRIGERPDKGYATQVFTSMSIGATRMEEARVGYIECDPSAGPGA